MLFLGKPSHRHKRWLCSGFAVHGENGASGKASIRPRFAGQREASRQQVKEDGDNSSGRFVGGSKFCDVPAASEVLNDTGVVSLR